MLDVKELKYDLYNQLPIMINHELELIIPNRSCFVDQTCLILGWLGPGEHGSCPSLRLRQQTVTTQTTATQGLRRRILRPRYSIGPLTRNTSYQH